MTFDAGTVKRNQNASAVIIAIIFINKITVVDDNDAGELLKNFSQAVAWSDFLYRKMPLTLVKM